MLAMRTGNFQTSCQPLHRIRRDGWTADRQLAFLDALARTRSITRAAAAAGMRRETAYRLRARPAGAVWAAAWDRSLEGHTRAAYPSAGVPNAQAKGSNFRQRSRTS